MNVRRRMWSAALLASSMLASPMLALVASGAPADDGTIRVRLSDEECAAVVALTGKPASKACYELISYGTGSPDTNIVAAAACYVPPGYTHCGSVWVKSQSVLLLWSVTSTAGYARNSSTGKVKWQSVTCTKTAFGYVVTITWCGSYHNGLPDTNFGANFDVSVLVQGSPLTVSHGHRYSINGYSGAGCCLQSW